MDRNQLIELITAEVLNVVREEGLTAPAATAAPPTGGSLASTVAAMVGAVAQSRPAPARGQRPLLLVCGNPMNTDWAVRYFQQFREACPSARVVLSNGAKYVFRSAKRPFAGFALREEDGDFDQQVDTYDSLLVVNTTVNTVSKLAALIADTMATIVVFRFLAAGKPVTLLVDGLETWYFTPAVRQKIQADLAHLRDYGITVCSSADTGVTGGGAGRPAGLEACLACTAASCESCGLCTVRTPDRVNSIIDAGAARVSQAPGARLVGGDIARLIDHTLLKPEATDDQVRELCAEARTYTFASVCVNPSKVKLAAELLRGSPVLVCTVVGFPLGATTAAVKASETRDAIANGADEIDMVINVGALKAKDYRTVKQDIEAVVQAAQGHTTKVILETSLLTDDEKKQACRLSKEAGADFVKTSTGFGSGGATVHDIALMRQAVGPVMGVKASGGVRDLETARKMVEAGATRIGASASVEIVTGTKGKSAY